MATLCMDMEATVKDAQWRETPPPVCPSTPLVSLLTLESIKLLHWRCCSEKMPGDAWSMQLMCFDYTHNTLHHSAFNMSSFKCFGTFLPSTFNDQEDEEIAEGTFAASTYFRPNKKRRHWWLRPFIHVRQWGWLSTKDLPLHVEFWKLTLCFTGPFKVVLIL